MCVIQILAGPNEIGSSQGVPKKKNFKLWILGTLGSLANEKIKCVRSPEVWGHKQFLRNQKPI